MTYSLSNKGLGICDRCGQCFKLREMHHQIIKQQDSGLIVCTSCLDEDHPQLMLGTKPIVDRQAIKNPRPDQDNGSRTITTPYDPSTHAVL